MNCLIRFARFWRHILSRFYTEIRFWVFPIPFTAQLWLINHIKHQAITNSCGPIVSLTTHGKRISTVFLTIESISRGQRLPSRIILWIDDLYLFNNLPASLCRLKRRGLEIKLCKNYGPHTKYYPYVAIENNFKIPLVIADDDQLYPRYWLKELQNAYLKFPDSVNCYWAKKINLDAAKVGKYASWGKNGTTTPSFCQIALGVSGVVYPPSFLKILKTNGKSFENVCPKADDLWLHVQALRAGYKVRQLRPKKLRCLEIPGSQIFALWRENDRGGGNDRQIIATYTTEDICKMLRE